MLNKIINNQKGSMAILLTMMILICVFSVTLITSNIIKNGMTMGREQVHSTKAFFAAESGAERILYELRIHNFDEAGCDGDTNKYVDFEPILACSNISQPYEFSNDVFTTVVYYNNNETFELGYHSYGNYKEIQRRIELLFN